MVNIFVYLYIMQATTINEFSVLVNDLMNTNNDMSIIESDILTAMGVRGMVFKSLDDLDEELFNWITKVFGGSVSDYFFDAINTKALSVNRIQNWVEDLIND